MFSAPSHQRTQSLCTSRCCSALIHSSFCFFGMCATTGFASNPSAPGSELRKFRSIFFKRVIVVTVCSYSASWNTGTCVGMSVAPTNVRERVLGGTIRKHCIDSASRTRAHPPTSMADRTAKYSQGKTRCNIGVCEDHDGYSTQPNQE